jgi:hypothetical protein
MTLRDVQNLDENHFLNSPYVTWEAARKYSFSIPKFFQDAD